MLFKTKCPLTLPSPHYKATHTIFIPPTILKLPASAPPPLIITFHVMFMLEKGYGGLNVEDTKVPYNKKKLFILKIVDRNMCIYFGFSSNP